MCNSIFLRTHLILLSTPTLSVHPSHKYKIKKFSLCTLKIPNITISSSPSPSFFSHFYAPSIFSSSPSHPSSSFSLYSPFSLAEHLISPLSPSLSPACPLTHLILLFLFLVLSLLSGHSLFFSSSRCPLSHHRLLLLSSARTGVFVPD